MHHCVCPCESPLSTHNGDTFFSSLFSHNTIRYYICMTHSVLLHPAGTYLTLKPTYSENGVSFIYTHRRLRAAYFGLTRHLDVLYTYQSFPELGLPNTNNALESLNASLKTKLRLHRGISRERKQRLIQSIIISYNPSSIKGS